MDIKVIEAQLAALIKYQDSKHFKESSVKDKGHVYSTARHLDMAVKHLKELDSALSYANLADDPTQKEIASRRLRDPFKTVLLEVPASRTDEITNKKYRLIKNTLAGLSMAGGTLKSTGVVYGEYETPKATTDDRTRLFTIAINKISHRISDLEEETVLVDDKPVLRLYGKVTPGARIASLRPDDFSIRPRLMTDTEGELDIVTWDLCIKEASTDD